MQLVFGYVKVMCPSVYSSKDALISSPDDVVPLAWWRTNAQPTKKIYLNIFL